VNHQLQRAGRDALPPGHPWVCEGTERSQGERHHRIASAGQPARSSSASGGKAPGRPRRGRHLQWGSPRGPMGQRHVLVGRQGDRRAGRSGRLDSGPVTVQGQEFRKKTPRSVRGGISDLGRTYVGGFNRSMWGFRAAWGTVRVQWIDRLLLEAERGDDRILSIRACLQNTVLFLSDDR